MMRKEDCIFCRIASGEIPSYTLHEDEHFRVILDLGPAARGHGLILPKEHAETLYDLSEETVGEAFVLARRMAVRIKEKLDCDGLNLVQNNGEAAGQTVKHFHMHIIPRYEGGPEMVAWKPGSVDPEEAEQIVEEVTARM